MTWEPLFRWPIWIFIVLFCLFFNFVKISFSVFQSPNFRTKILSYFLSFWVDSVPPMLSTMPDINWQQLLSKVIDYCWSVSTHLSYWPCSRKGGQEMGEAVGWPQWKIQKCRCGSKLGRKISWDQAFLDFLLLAQALCSTEANFQCFKTSVFDLRTWK